MKIKLDSKNLTIDMIFSENAVLSFQVDTKEEINKYFLAYEFLYIKGGQS